MTPIAKTWALSDQKKAYNNILPLPYTVSSLLGRHLWDWHKVFVLRVEFPCYRESNKGSKLMAGTNSCVCFTTQGVLLIEVSVSEG